MKRLIFLTIIATVLFGGILLYRWASQPVVSTVPQTKTIVQGVQKTAPNKLESPYFSSLLHGSLLVRSDSLNPDSPTWEQLVAQSSDGRSSDQLAITIGRMPTNGLNEVSAVQFRRLNPERYEVVEIAGMPTNALVFRSTVAEYEVAVFWPNDDRYAAIVASGLNARQAVINDQLMTTINNWVWR